MNVLKRLSAVLVSAAIMCAGGSAVYAENETGVSSVNCSGARRYSAANREPRKIWSWWNLITSTGVAASIAGQRIHSAGVSPGKPRMR